MTVPINQVPANRRPVLWSEINGQIEPISIPGSDDLNNYTTTGVYIQRISAAAASGSNYPGTPLAGLLEVFSDPVSAVVYQTYSELTVGKVYIRTLYNSNWYPWKELSTVGHKHPVGELDTSNSPTATTFLRGDGQWIVPTNTTYAVMTEAEATTGTATTARTMSAAGIKGAIQRWATGTYSTAISAIGQALNRAATAAEARTAIGAGTSDLAIGTTASTAKAGNWMPTWGDVTGKPTTFSPSTHSHAQSDITGLTAALAAKVGSSNSTITEALSMTEAAYNALGTKVSTTLYILT